MAKTLAQGRRPGSGRPPDPMKQFTEKHIPIVNVGGEPLVLPNVSGDQSPGVVTKTPVKDIDIANKKYVDDNAGAGTWTDTSTNTGTNKTLDDFSNHVEADEIHEELRNESGATMNRGDAVYISGFSVGQVKALVTLADNDSTTTMPAVALLEDSSLDNNATGHFIEIGSLKDMNTGAFSAGDFLYVSGQTTTGQTLTNVKPTGATEQIQRVAVVLRSHASNGVIEIFGAGRENDSPNYMDIPGTVSGQDIIITADFDVSGQALARNVVIGTEASPGAASQFTQGTIYLQYTA